MGLSPRFTKPRVIKGLIYTLLPFRSRFRILTEFMIPKALYTDAPVAGYHLIIVHDLVFLPWASTSGRKLLSSEGRFHIDLHEYFGWDPPVQFDRITRRLLAGYHRWVKTFIGSAAFHSRSTVANGIADLYASEFGVRPSLVRNTMPYVDQRPTPVVDESIQLIYHGNADLSRGLALLIDAMKALEPRFVLNLMLTGPEEGRNQLIALTSGLGDRVVFVDPVPLNDVANRLNEFDLEIMFFPPTRPNLLFALPNKFFQAVQGRLGLIVGPSPSMTELIDIYGNGLAVAGWAAKDLASGINGLTSDQIRKMKSASDLAASDLNSEKEKLRFLSGMLGQTDLQ